MEAGFMKEGLGFGVGIVEGRALRISRSSKSKEASEMLPSSGSLSDTSSIRACDIMASCGVCATSERAQRVLEFLGGVEMAGLRFRGLD